MKLTANKYPDRDFIISCDEKIRLTFGEALRKADKLAAGLLNSGLEKGDTVGIWSPNFEFWITSMIAMARAGLVCVTLNPAYQLPELDYCIKKVGIKAIIAPEEFRKQKFYEMLKALVPDTKNNSSSPLRHIIINSDKNLSDALRYNDLLNYSSESDLSAIDKLQSTISPESCFNIQFTSGTTGRSKAARVSHFSLVNCGYEIGKRYDFHNNYARILVNNPLFHAYGTSISILVALTHGSALILPAPHFTPELSLRALRDENANVVYGTPTMFVDLIAKKKELNMKLPKIDIANTAGAICTPSLVKDIEKHLNAEKVRSIYGLTETTSAVFQSMLDDHNENIQSTVGALCDHVEAKVIDENGNIVPFGQPGELCIRSYLTLMDYFDDEDKTKEVLSADKWLRTGDQFVIHENGYGQIVGRLKEMIIRGGENIYPKEIEDFINTHSNVKEAHVIGIPDERLGEEVAAFIRVNDESKPLTKEEVHEFCKGKLAHFKIPKYVFTVDEFPRTVSGKIQKFKFLDVYSHLLEDIVKEKREKAHN
ncbi:hypothetical protein ACKWTF_013836 [Chironomus riparius]